MSTETHRVDLSNETTAVFYSDGSIVLQALPYDFELSVSEVRRLIIEINGTR